MNPWFYLILLGWVAVGVSSCTRIGIWLLVSVAVVLSVLAIVVVASNGSVLPPLPWPLLSVGTIASSVSGAVLFAWALRRSGIGGRKAKAK